MRYFNKLSAPGGSPYPLSQPNWTEEKEKALLARLSPEQRKQYIASAKSTEDAAAFRQDPNVSYNDIPEGKLREMGMPRPIYDNSPGYVSPISNETAPTPDLHSQAKSKFINPADPRTFSFNTLVKGENMLNRATQAGAFVPGPVGVASTMYQGVRNLTPVTQSITPTRTSTKQVRDRYRKPNGKFDTVGAMLDTAIPLTATSLSLSPSFMAPLNQITGNTVKSMAPTGVQNFVNNTIPQVASKFKLTKGIASNLPEMITKGVGSAVNNNAIKSNLQSVRDSHFANEDINQNNQQPASLKATQK